MSVLKKDFYKKSALDLSKELLGKIFVHIVDGKKLKGRIVEVEAYMGVEDKAAHSYGGRRTNRTEVMYGEAGVLYVFSIYGMHCCANIIAAEINIPQAVLIRALEPVEGLEEMAVRRYNKAYEELSTKQKLNLTNGPGKLCKAMGIEKTHNAVELGKDDFYLEDDGFSSEIVSGKRIGIDYAEEAADYLWRFCVKGNKYISVKI